MGAEIFYHTVAGDTVKAAFKNAVEEACHDYGHAGYTGTIAEKDSYIVIDCPDGIKPEQYADQLINEDDERIEDKWGPAGAIKIKDGYWLFFGWASS